MAAHVVLGTRRLVHHGTHIAPTPAIGLTPITIGASSLGATWIRAALMQCHLRFSQARPTPPTTATCRVAAKAIATPTLHGTKPISGPRIVPMIPRAAKPTRPTKLAAVHACSRVKLCPRPCTTTTPANPQPDATTAQIARSTLECIRRWQPSSTMALLASLGISSQEPHGTVIALLAPSGAVMITIGANNLGATWIQAVPPQFHQRCSVAPTLDSTATTHAPMRQIATARSHGTALHRLPRHVLSTARIMVGTQTLSVQMDGASEAQLRRLR